MPTLLDSINLSGLTLKNRIALAPMTRARSGEQRIPNELMKEYYLQRANAGLIITEATVVSQQGIGWINSPGIYNQQQQDAWKTIADAIRQAGSVSVMQFWHCGRASHPDFLNGETPVSASATRINGESHTPLGKKPYEMARALETSEIPTIVDDYRQAAIRAKAAGFDGVEIHSANGYLLDQFLQSKTNHRTDAYGGSIENRTRLLSEVIEAVSETWPRNRIAVRLSPNGAFNDMGSPDYREQFTYTIQKLNEHGLMYLHVMDGLAFGFHGLGEPFTLDEVRAVYDHPVMGNCGYTHETAEEAIQSGKADMIAFGRPYISNPDLAIRFAQGIPLAKDAPVTVWSAPGAEGYTDFPAAG